MWYLIIMALLEIPRPKEGARPGDRGCSFKSKAQQTRATDKPALRKGINILKTEKTV